MAGTKPLAIVFIGFALLLACLTLQVLVSLSLPFIKPINFLQVDSAAGQSLTVS